MSRKKSSYIQTQRAGSTIYYLSRQTGSPTDSCHRHEIGGKKATHGGGSGDCLESFTPESNSREESRMKIHLLTKTAFSCRTQPE